MHIPVSQRLARREIKLEVARRGIYAVSQDSLIVYEV